MHKTVFYIQGLLKLVKVYQYWINIHEPWLTINLQCWMDKVKITFKQRTYSLCQPLSLWQNWIWDHMWARIEVFREGICCHIFLNCCQNRQYFPICCQLPEAICCRLPNLIVARCDWNLSNCCMLRPIMWQLLRVAAKFPSVARCRIPQYVPTHALLVC